MTDYANAPAPHSALFDDAPTVTALDAPAITTAGATWFLPPATRIAQARDGTWYAKDVTMQYGRPLPLALALKRVAIGRTVFVRREDADAVLEAARRASGVVKEAMLLTPDGARGVLVEQGVVIVRVGVGDGAHD